MTNIEKIRDLLKTNKIVVETEYKTDPENRAAYRSYIVWIIEDGELDKTCVICDELCGDEALDILGSHGYNSDSGLVYPWSHSVFYSYKNEEEYDKAGWFFVNDESGKYSGHYFLG